MPNTEKLKSYDEAFIPQKAFKIKWDHQDLHKLQITSHKEAIKYLSQKYNINASKIVIPFLKKFLFIARGWVMMRTDFFTIFPSRAKIKKYMVDLWDHKQSVWEYNHPDLVGKIRYVRYGWKRPVYTKRRKKKNKNFMKWKSNDKHIELLKEAGLWKEDTKYTRKDVITLLQKFNKNK